MITIDLNQHDIDDIINILSDIAEECTYYNTKNNGCTGEDIIYYIDQLRDASSI